MKSIENTDLSRAEYVYKRIREGIRNGQYRPGYRLRETELAERLKVSRTPIREAIRRLAADGLIELSSSRGMMIIELDKQKVREMYAVRETLEGAVARYAAQHASASDIETMRALLQREKKAKSPKEILKVNRLFHQAMQEASHNRYLVHILHMLYDLLAVLPGNPFEMPARVIEAQKEHLAVLTAIEQRNPEVAEQLARQHIQNAGIARLRQMFEA
ncbi:MAG TPA: GntR family transcriptional regulator [Bryobacteraceae bacterium]|nr:GntR family transcriptional regulator [Bryobacteraceae bacterium]